jgi:hypothetical protein
MANQPPSLPLDNAAIFALASTAAPQSYVNWKLCVGGAPCTSVVEAPIYTDTWILGEYETGPLKFINTIADPHRRTDLRPGIVLRFSCHWPAYGYVPVTGTKDGHYHGGDHFDEIASLISLVLGIRAQAGPVTRDFRIGGDPLGTPILRSSMKLTPILGHSAVQPMLSRIREDVNLVKLSDLEKIPTLTEYEASAVVKCARTYQSALWFADSNTETSWLLLVSAIETAARHWAKENFEGHDPALETEVEKILQEHKCPESVYAPLAHLLRNNTKAMRKFVAFLTAFLPDPPPDNERPESQKLRIGYKIEELVTDFKEIYNYRSRALHDSIPFPYPMCIPAVLKEERNFSLGASTLGATWDFRDYKPLMFHTFEHLVRGALLRWIGSL